MMKNSHSDFEQISIFDIGKTPLKIDKPVRLIELFAGIGSQAKALERLGVDFEHYRVCEFDKYAVKSYNAIHGTDFATSDITQITASDLGIVDTDKYCYITTYSFPCQDLSLAGLQKGMAKGDNTRSGLLWEVERLLNECEELPQILLMENVTQVHGKKNIEHFNEWIEYLESKGYSNYWEDLNAKNYGIPQNRNRTFMVSVLGDYTYEFPKPIPLEIRLKHLLEHNVDEKYYLSDKGLKYVLKRVGKYTQICNEDTEVAKSAITAVGNANWTGNFIEEPNVWDGYNQRIRAEKGTVGTLATDGSSPKHNNRVIEDVRTRKLTPKECYRLMGFDDEDFDKAAQHNSNAQLYKQAGKSIVVDVLAAIFKNMF
jgi:DNA (cytosine-5)-methyltransferase 1